MTFMSQVRSITVGLSINNGSLFRLIPIHAIFRNISASFQNESSLSQNESCIVLIGLIPD